MRNDSSGNGFNIAGIVLGLIALGCSFYLSTFDKCLKYDLSNNFKDGVAPVLPLSMVFFALIFFVAVCVLNLKDKKNKSAIVLSDMKKKYEDSLTQGNKAEALKLGRAYYSSKKGGGELSITEEQALSNDLSTMH